MRIEDEVRLGDISKEMADTVRYAGQSEGLSKPNIAIKVSNCAEQAMIHSDDASAWLCWLAEAVDWILIGAGLHDADIGTMMTRQEDEIHGTLGRR